MKTKRSLALPFVAVVSAASGLASCTPEPEPPKVPERVRPTPPRGNVPTSPGVKDVQRYTQRVGGNDYYHEKADGSNECSLSANVSCPPMATCNPPPPTVGECAGAGPRPAGWDDSLRIPSRFYAGRHGCSYTEDVLCPTPASGGGSCTEQVTYELSCTVTADAETKKDRITVPSFSFGNVLGECFTVDTFECEDGLCALPEPRKIDCAP